MTCDCGHSFVGTLNFPCSACHKIRGGYTHGDPVTAVAYGHNNTSGPIDTAGALSAKGGSGRIDFETETFLVQHTAPVSAPVSASYGRLWGQKESQSGVRELDVHATIDANKGSRRQEGIVAGAEVRRLSVCECERLMGFPDGYTLIPWRNKPREKCPDGPRYKALGNSIAVPVLQWIGRRITLVEEILRELPPKRRTPG